MSSPKPSLPELLRQHFPDAHFDECDPALAIGSFQAWDSMAHFNFLLLVEETYGVQFTVAEMTGLKSIEAIAATLAKRMAV